MSYKFNPFSGTFDIVEPSKWQDNPNSSSYLGLKDQTQGLWTGTDTTYAVGGTNPNYNFVNDSGSGNGRLGIFGFSVHGDGGFVEYGALQFFNSSRGSAASPSALQNGDVIGGQAFGGYDGSTYNLTVGGMLATVTGAVSAGTLPYKVALWTNNAERVFVDWTGNFNVNNDEYLTGGLYGGTATSDSLDLYANSGTLGTFGGEYINIHHGIVFDETFTIENDGLGGFSQYEFRHLDFGGTYTIENGGNVGDITALWADYTVRYSNSQAIAAQSIFDGRPTIQPTAAVNDNAAFSAWRVFTAIPTFGPDLSTAITATTANIHAVFSAPQVGLTAGSHASAQAVVTNMNAYKGLLAVGHANATVTNGAIFYAESAANIGTLTNMYQFRADTLTVGSTNRVAARFDSPSSGATFGTTLWLSGNTDATTELGGIVFGSSKDTNLYRSAANKLKTDDDFEAASWTNLPKRTITVVLDGGGSTLTTGAQKAYVSVPYTGTITKWRIVALDGNTGSITLDIWKDTYANFAPTDADSITASDQPTISSANKNEGSSLTGWTTSVTEGDILEFNIDSVTTFTKVKLELFMEATS